jgi:hypothetical protein
MIYAWGTEDSLARMRVRGYIRADTQREAIQDAATVARQLVDAGHIRPNADGHVVIAVECIVHLDTLGHQL